MENIQRKLLSTLMGGIVVIAGAGAARPGGAVAPESAPGAAGVVAPESAPGLQTIAFAPAATALSRSAPGARAVAPRNTARFSLLGATWDDPRRTVGDAVEVRTRRAADGGWTAWQRLESDGPAPVEPGSRDAAAPRGSTDPVWVGESDGVEARLTTTGGWSAPPAGLRLDLIDPDAPAPRRNPDAAPPPVAPRRAAEVTVPPRPAPTLVTRAGWRADEAIVQDAPEYTSDVQVLFVHHTAGTNAYSCAQSATIIRGIQAYHVRSKHWDDIGYNFLVDKCGTLFEGRRGGVGRAVLGAHTLGFNAHSSAIAVLGNYTGRSAPPAVTRVIAQVAAYKIGAYGNAPAGRAAMVSSGSDRYAKGSTAMLNRISGHRDTGRTECPGNRLYAQLGTIRSLAGAGPAGLALSKMNGATRVGSTYWTRGTIRPYWQVDTASTLLYRFDVLVDGVLTASVARTGRQQLLTLSPGQHTVRVRAVALNGRTAVSDTTVVVDATPPEFTGGPGVELRTGSLNGIVPVRLRWDVGDEGGLGALALTGPATVDLPVTASVWAGTVRPGAPTTYGLRATDRAGNVRSATTEATAYVAAETLADRGGSWDELASSTYLGGRALRSTTADSSLTWAFTGRAAALAVSRTDVSGRVRVFADGEPAGLVDLHSPQALDRRAVWTRSWPEGGRHTVRIEVEGTAGRPGVVADGLAYLR